MEAISLSELRPGAVFDGPLLSKSRRLLLAAGVPLTEEMCRLISESGEPGAYIAPPPKRKTMLLVPAAPILPERSEPEPGPERAVPLDRRKEHERAVIQARARLRQAAEAAVRERLPRWERLARRVTPGHDPVGFATDGVAGEAVDALDQTLAGVRADGVATLRRILGRLLDGEPVGAEALDEHAGELVDRLARHPGRYARLALGLPRPTDSIPDHCYTTGAIAVGIAARLGWSRADVRTAGVAGMLADAGMALVPPGIRRAGRPLTDVEANAVRRHPVYSVAMLRAVGGLPEEALLGAWQHHERLDGSGYPGGARAEEIHDLARVLAVAETLAGMTAPRAHRPPITAHAALSELASEAAAGRFDKACVRGAVEALGLFPAGSFVRLSTGHLAMVAAGGAGLGPGRGDRPIVRVVQPEGAEHPLGEELDLAWWTPRDVRVVEAVPAPQGF